MSCSGQSGHCKQTQRRGNAGEGRVLRLDTKVEIKIGPLVTASKESLHLDARLNVVRYEDYLVTHTHTHAHVHAHTPMH